jgi:hypothetical protein
MLRNGGKCAEQNHGPLPNVDGDIDPAAEQRSPRSSYEHTNRVGS